MSSCAAYEAIVARWAALWSSQTLTALGNAPFSPVAGTPWVRLSVIDGAAGQVSVGTPGASLDRHAGLIVAQVFTPSGEGESRARWLADEAAVIFRKQSFDGIDCGVPVVTPVGPDGAWFQVNMECPFTRHELT